MFYTNLADAKEVLLGRTEYTGDVEKMWKAKGLSVPFSFSKPTAVIGRPAIFRIESVLVIHMAESHGMDISWLTYDDDRYVDASKVKRSLVQPYFADKLDKKGNFISHRVRLIENLRPIQLVELSKIISDDGVSVLSLHRERLLQAYPNVHISDMSHWAKSLGGNALAYYEAYLSLFVSHAILFEDYHGGESGEGLSSFTKQVFEPAFANVTQRFGVKPIVVKLPWKPHYAYYPKGEMLDKWREMVVPRL